MRMNVVVAAYRVVAFLLYFCVVSAEQDRGSCENGINGECTSIRPIRYLFYDVNPPEGFNLRRDVYMRLAILITELQNKGNWVLVLPPWPNLYHWRTHIPQERLPWSLFFDVPSLQKFAPVIELIDFLDIQPSGHVDKVYILQHFEDMFKTGKFVDKLEVQSCNNPHSYTKNSTTRRYHGNFWGFGEISAASVECLSFHGPASTVIPLFHKLPHASFMLDHAETVLHDRYGDATYWRARRSMRFAKSLYEFAASYRAQYLNSTDEYDGVSQPFDWTLEKAHRRAKGGPYLCVHLRRRDFVRARGDAVPTLTGAAKQVQRTLKELDLNTVFIATDAPPHEKEELEETLAKHGITMKTFQPTSAELNKFKDGGVAIIEQIVCSYARKFYGSHESTFSFRIQEEREILGFRPEMTFNRLCGDDHQTCQQPAKWLIRY